MLKIQAKFPGSGFITTAIPSEEGITEDRVRLLLNQPFVQQSIRPLSGWYRVDQLEYNENKNPREANVSYVPINGKKLKTFNLSYIISGQNQIKLSPTNLKLFTKRPEDLSYLVGSQVFKGYLFLVMSHELQNMKKEDYNISLEEVSVEDEELMIVFDRK